MWNCKTGRSHLLGLADAMMENMTLCGAAGQPCSSDCKTYRVPLAQCFSPALRYPGDEQWGPFDVIDICQGSFLNRSFFATTDGSCRNRTDGFVVPLNECVGPFGKPRPFGKFSCTAAALSPPPPPPPPLPPPPPSVMPHLLLPPWPATYNLTMSTMTQTCFGPTGKTGPTDPKGAALNNATGAFLRKWGIIALDFESREALWSRHSPKDADVMMLEQVKQMKRIAPQTRFWIYRNLVQAYSNFVELRAKLEDPQYAGWFVHFGAHNNESLTPRCAYNPRVGHQLCTDLFHTSLAWTADGHDCGDVIPCGDYVFDHRNASLRTWLIETHKAKPKLGVAPRGNFR